MRHLLVIALLLYIPAAACADAVTPQTFQTNATFSVGDIRFSPSSAIAIMVPRPGAAGYSLLQIHFYTFPPSASDIESISKGSVASMDSKAAALPTTAYNMSHVTLQLGMDKDLHVWQVDMSVPGYGCTIAGSKKDVEGFLQHYTFDPGHLMLKSTGSFNCEMTHGNEKFNWDLNVNLPVFKPN